MANELIDEFNIVNVKKALVSVLMLGYIPSVKFISLPWVMGYKLFEE